MEFHEVEKSRSLVSSSAKSSSQDAPSQQNSADTMTGSKPNPSWVEQMLQDRGS